LFGRVTLLFGHFLKVWVEHKSLCKIFFFFLSKSKDMAKRKFVRLEKSELQSLRQKCGYYVLRYPYFGVVVGLAWSYDPESYADGSVAAGRISHGQVKGDNPEKKGIPWPSRLGVGRGVDGPTPLKALAVEKLLTIAERAIIKEAKVLHGL
jgi:hypothetical protein